jgi:hypothetical protein
LETQVWQQQGQQQGQQKGQQTQSRRAISSSETERKAWEQQGPQWWLVGLALALQMWD